MVTAGVRWGNGQSIRGDPMRRVLHVTKDTQYTMEGGMVFAKGLHDQTVIIAADVDALHALQAQLNRLNEEMTHGDARVPQRNSTWRE